MGEQLLNLILIQDRHTEAVAEAAARGTSFGAPTAAEVRRIPGGCS